MYDKVVLVSIDTLRADAISANPYKIYSHTHQLKQKLVQSHLDDLIAKSCFFNNVISSAPYTATSHASYFTGLWPKHNGVYDHFNSKLKAKTIFETAKEYGYVTTFKTDFPFILGDFLNFTNGIDNYFVEDDQQPLNLLKKKKKFFSFFHFGQVHYPYGFHNLKYGGQDYKDKVVALEKKYNLSHKDFDLKDMATETKRSQKDLEWLYRYKNIVLSLYKRRLDNDLLDLYLEGVNYFHLHKFNSFLDQLLEILNGSNFLLVIFSDHGENWSDEASGHFNSLDESVLRVPMLFYASDIKAFNYSNRVRSVDLVPTLSEILFQKKGDYDGKSLKKYIYNQKMDDDRDAFSLCWITKMEDITSNIKRLEKQDANNPDISKSVNFGACAYQGKFKLINRLHSFKNRGTRIEKVEQVELFDMSDLSKPKRTPMSNLKEPLLPKIKDFNDIKQVDNHNPDFIRKYLVLQGYHV